MDTKETYEYLKEHYHANDPVAIEQVAALYQMAAGLDNGYCRVLNLLMTAYTMGYAQAQIDVISGMNDILAEPNEELETPLKDE